MRESSVQSAPQPLQPLQHPQQQQQLSSSSSNTMQVHTAKLWVLPLDRQLTMLREGDMGAWGINVQNPQEHG